MNDVELFTAALEVIRRGVADHDDGDNDVPIKFLLRIEPWARLRLAEAKRESLREASNP